MIFLVALHMQFKQKKSQAQSYVQKKLQWVKFGVSKSLYKGQTRKKTKLEIFEGQFRTLNKMFSTI